MGHSNAGAGDSSNLSYVESLYLEYQKSPELVSPDWRDYFRQLSEAQSHSDHESSGHGLFRPLHSNETGLVSPAELDYAILQERVDRLIRNYRGMGHYAADIDPLGQPRARVPELDPDTCGFKPSDLDRKFSTMGAGGADLRTLREIVQWLKNTYCRSIGAQFMHIGAAGSAGAGHQLAAAAGAVEPRPGDGHHRRTRHARRHCSLRLAARQHAAHSAAAELPGPL